MTSLRLGFCTDGPEGDLESIPLRDHLTISGVEAWQEEDGQLEAAAQPAPLPQPSALTPPRHHTVAPGDAGWAGRQCKCSALRTFSASVWKTQQKRIQDRVLKATSLKGVITMRGAEKPVGSAGGLGTSSGLILKQIHLFRGITSPSPQGLLTRTPGSKFFFPKNELPSPRTPPLGILLPSSRPDFSFSGSPSNKSKTLSRFIFTIHLASTGQMPSPLAQPASTHATSTPQPRTTSPRVPVCSSRKQKYYPCPAYSRVCWDPAMEPWESAVSTERKAEGQERRQLCLQELDSVS